MGVEVRDDAPVLIAQGCFTYPGDAANSPSPPELLKVAAERAALDAGLEGSVIADLDALAVVTFGIDADEGRPELQRLARSQPVRFGLS